MPVRGGVRSLVREQYHRRGTVCPDKGRPPLLRRARPLGRPPDPLRGPHRLGRRRRAGAVRRPEGQAGRALVLGPAADANEVTYEDAPQSDGRVVDEAARPHRRAFERMCGYLWESDFRFTGTGRHTGEQVFATLADPPAQQLLAPPPIAVIRPGVFTRAPGCTEKARLYPGGWAAMPTSPDRALRIAEVADDSAFGEPRREPVTATTTTSSGRGARLSTGLHAGREPGG